MPLQDMISANAFCVHHRIEISFLHSLQDYGLIEITTENEDCYLQPDQVSIVERLVRLHYDLHINMEGMDAVENLLRRMEAMQTELALLRNQLSLYESRS